MSSCVGWSGAGLANLMNEAAIVAARLNASAIGDVHIDVAIDRATVGLPKETGLHRSQRGLVAMHEAGHAVVALLTEDYDTITKVGPAAAHAAAAHAISIPSPCHLHTISTDPSEGLVGGSHAAETSTGVRCT